VIYGDIGNLETCCAACKGIDLVVHIAAVTHALDETSYFDVNVGGTRCLLEACNTNNVDRFILISTSSACDEAGAYGKSKKAAEDLVRASKFNWTIVRPSEIYGNDISEGIGALISLIKRSWLIPIIGNGKYTLSPLLIDDAVQSIYEIIWRDDVDDSIVPLLGPETLEFRSFVYRIIKYFSVRRTVIFVPVWLAKCFVFISVWLRVNTVVPDQIPRLLCDKDQKQYGLTPIESEKFRTLEEGLRVYHDVNDLPTNSTIGSRR
jgi:NADH dehydrogenase